MPRALFSALSRKTETTGPNRPWWSVLSVNGWLIVLIAVVSTAFLIIGAISGEVMFLPPVKSRSGDVASASLQSEPIWYFVLMALNAVVSFVAWAMFITWLKSRRA
jgi:hypothetical protein